MIDDDDRALIKALVREAIKEQVNEYARNVSKLFGIVEGVRSAMHVLDEMPIAKAKSHGDLRVDAILAAPEGVCLEFGVWKGDWLTALATRFPERRFVGFDSFEGLPDDWGRFKKGYFDTGGVMPDVPPNVDLVKGWFIDALPLWLAQNQDNVAFIHLDCDCYSSTMDVLPLLRRRLQVGTQIVLDDWMLEAGWQREEKRAFLDFCAGYGIGFEYTGYSAEEPTVSASVVLTKV